MIIVRTIISTIFKSFMSKEKLWLMELWGNLWHRWQGSVNQSWFHPLNGKNISQLYLNVAPVPLIPESKYALLVQGDWRSKNVSLNDQHTLFLSSKTKGKGVIRSSWCLSTQQSCNSSDWRTCSEFNPSAKVINIAAFACSPHLFPLEPNSGLLL